MEINQANKPSEFICSICTWTLYLPVGICYCFKAENKKKNPVGECSSCNRIRLQNSPYFCVFKYARVVKQKVWNEAENRERDWGEMLKCFFFSRLPCRMGVSGLRALRA